MRSLEELRPVDIKKDMFVQLEFDDSPGRILQGYVTNQKFRWCYIRHHANTKKGRNYYYSIGIDRWLQRSHIEDGKRDRQVRIYKSDINILPESLKNQLKKIL